MFPIIRECRSAAAPITTAVTDDGTLLILPRYTQPEKDHQLLLQRLQLVLLPQPPPPICSQDENLPDGASATSAM